MVFALAAAGVVLSEARDNREEENRRGKGKEKQREKENLKGRENLKGKENRKEKEKSRGVRRILRMLLLLCVFLLGYFRMEKEFAAWEKVESALPEDGDSVKVSGKVTDIREKGKYRVMTVKTEEFGKILVYMEKGKENIQRRDVSEEGDENGNTGEGNRDVNEGNQEAKEVNRGVRESNRDTFEIGIGQRISATGKASLFGKAGNPGQFDLRKYYRAQGISMTIFALKVETSREGRDSVSPYFNGLYCLRRKCSRILGKLCREEDEGIFRAAILGEKEGMDGEIKDLYQKNGIAHLLAISGLHLSMLGMGLYGLLRKFGLGYGSAGLVSGIVMISYGLMTGGSGSALRAVIMLLTGFLAAYLGRSYDLLSALSLAALLLAGSRPFSVGEAGFQLSFGAVLGIGLLGEQLILAADARKGWQKNLVSSLAIQLITAPVIFWHYFQYPVYGIILNLLVIPLMGYVILSGLLGIGLGWLFPVLGIMAVGSGHYILQWYQVLCRFFSRLPGYQAVFGRPGWGQVAVYYLILGGMCIALKISGGKFGIEGEKTVDNGGLIEKYSEKLSYSGKEANKIGGQSENGRQRKSSRERLGREKPRKEEAEREKSGREIPERKKSEREIPGREKSEREIPGREKLEREIPGRKRWRRKTKNRIILVVGSLCCFFSLRPLPQKGCDIAFLDVGQGDGIVIRWEGNRKAGRPSVVLVDGGSSSDKKLGTNRLEPYLKSQGITRIDVAVVSHGDEDHVSGLRYLLEECEDIDIRQLILPELGREYKDPAYDRLVSAAKKRGTDVVYMKAGDEMEKGKCRFTCLYPEAGEEIDASDRNQQSLITKMDYEDFHLLLTGDADSGGEGRMVSRYGQEKLSDIQILKAAHHGSRFSNSRNFLEAVRPDITVISYETGNSYGHPHEEVLERLEEAGSLVLKTGESGAVLMHVEQGILRYRIYDDRMANQASE